MREIKDIFLAFSVFLLSGLVSGCAAHLADPTGPNSSLVIGRVIISNQYSGGGGTLPIGIVDSGIDVEIESKDESQFIKVTTGRGGYFLVPNIDPNTYYLSKVILKGSGPSQEDRAHINFSKRSFFSPVPREILDVGTYRIDVSENFRVTVKLPLSNPEAVRSYLSERYPGTSWLARKFASGPAATGEQVYSNSGKGYRVVVPPPQEWDARPGRIRVVDVRFQNKASSQKMQGPLWTRRD